jgi:hypothetical protein
VTSTAGTTATETTGTTGTTVTQITGTTASTTEPSTATRDVAMDGSVVLAVAPVV